MRGAPATVGGGSSRTLSFGRLVSLATICSLAMICLATQFVGAAYASLKMPQQQSAQRKGTAVSARLPTLQQRAAQGDPKSQCALGELYDTGEGVPEDNERAVTWY